MYKIVRRSFNFLNPRTFQAYATLIFLAAELASACTVVEVEVPPQKVGSNVTVVALKNKQPLVGISIVVERLENEKTMKPLLTITQVATNTRGEIALSRMSPGIYALSVLEKEHKHWLGSIRVSSQSDTDSSHVEFELLPEAPPPPLRPAPLLVQRIAGRLYDSSGAVFANTQFQVKNLDVNDAGLEMQGSTNTRGEFSLAVPDGNYELHVAVSGFNPALVPLEVTANSDRAWRGIELKLELARCGAGRNPYRYSVTEQITEN